jgi:hypothetical protein
MKKLIAIVSVVGFFAFHALADGMPRIPEIINFDLVYQTQGSNYYTTTTSGTVTNYIHKTLEGNAVHITSKDIIKFIGAAFETNFPPGSQLALYAGRVVPSYVSKGLPFYEGEIVIVDSTGANVIFYPDEVTPPNNSSSRFYYRMDEGVVSGKEVSNSQNDYSEDYAERSIIHIYLYNYPNIEIALAATRDLSTNTFDLALGGLITQHYSYNFDYSNHTWVEKVYGNLTGLAGEGSIGDQYGILTGSAEDHGSARVTER